MALVPGTIGVSTATYGHVYSERHDSEPPLNLTEWYHVTDASLEIRSGVLCVIGCMDEVGVDFDVASGNIA